MTGSCLQSCRGYSKPSWLQATLSELEQQMQTLGRSLPDEDEPDSFAERAENYYRKRPQLLSLLQDLYNRHLTLADRYCQALLKNPSQFPPTLHSDVDDDASTTTNDRPISITYSYPDSDTDSSLSFHHTFPLPFSSRYSCDTLVAELVSRTVDNELLLHEVEMMERYRVESSRKMELQKSLLEVLESERMVLLSENARLGYRAVTVADENRGLATEAAVMRRKATDLARVVLKLREEMEGKIRGLEKRNREYFEEMLRREEEKRVVVREVCIEVEKLKLENARLKEEALRRAKEGEWWKATRWLDRVKRFELFPPCGGSYSR